jgi:hypothetical protein
MLQGNLLPSSPVSSRLVLKVSFLFFVYAHSVFFSFSYCVPKMTRFAVLLALAFLGDAALSQFATTTSSRIENEKRVNVWSFKTSSTATLGPMPTGLDLERVCTEGDNVKMGFNYSPSRWCYCAAWGPFPTVSGATTDYCKFTATPTATITLVDDSRLPTTTEDTACHVMT